MIIKCTCNHKAQDELNGKGMRVANTGTKEVRCTVCGKASKK